MISTTKNTKLGVNPISGVIFLILTGASIGAYYLGYINNWMLVLLLIISLLIASSVHIADQWEKAIVLRMGKYTGLRGPGIFFTVPIIDKVDNYIDQRVRVTEFKAEQTLTKDTVPVNVDAVVYWTVWDVEKAAFEVQDYGMAIAYIAQTGLRDVIGKHELAELLQERDKVTDLLQRTLDEHTNPWGITWVLKILLSRNYWLTP
jgi:regulator of protease activity HflC (stomatin/prohibitin superfamily)